MFEYEVAAAIAPLKAEAEAKLREDSKAAKGKVADVLRYAADHLFDPAFDTCKALADLSVSRNVMTAAGRVLGAALGVKAKPLRIHVYDVRIDVAHRFVAAYPDASLWMVIAEVGIPNPETFDRALSARGGTRPDLRGRVLQVGFDYVTYDRERRDRLAAKDRGRLVERLRRAYPAGGGPPPPEFALPERATLPEHRFGCTVELVPRGPQRVVLVRALEDCFYRIAADRSRLPHVLQLLFDDLCEYLFTDPAVDYSGKALLRDANDDRRAALGFLLGEYVADYRHREQVQLATPLFVETSLSYTTVAKVVGLSEEKLVQVYEARTGERPEAVRERKRVDPREPYDLWRRALTGTLAPAEVARLTAVLQQPPKPEPARILVPDRHRPAEVDIDPRFLIPPEEWEALRSVAVQLSWENRFEARPEIERALSVSEFAPSLYRIRQVQCVETAYRQLMAGKKPAVDPYASWLKHRRKADGQEESPLAVWEGVVGSLVDAPAAFAALKGLEEKRCQLLAMPEAERKAAIEDASNGFQDYRLAWWFLIVEEAFHRRFGDYAAAQGQIAVWIARALPEEVQCGATRAVFGIGSARQGNGYKTAGLIDRAKRSFVPALAVVGEVGPYAEGDILSLYAATLLGNSGTSAREARERLLQAIDTLGQFDGHLAAKATMLMAEAERVDAGSAYISTLKTAIGGLDRYREPKALEGAHTNLLFYLVAERRIEETRRWKDALPYPKDRVIRVYRKAVDGCAEIVATDFDLAESLFRCAERWATTIGCRTELISILLYLAFIKHEKSEFEDCRSYVERALAIATGFGLDQAPAIAALLANLRMREDVANLLLTEAVKAGGCLGPKVEAA